MSEERTDLEWIPWRRYVVLLTIDKMQYVNLGRFRLKKSACKQSDRLTAYKGYKLKIVDTKHNLFIHQPVDKEIYYRQLRWQQKNRKELNK
ncbi:MAG: hypothetical protein JRC91_01530 [Deltaproteobacteria bacterium]|nr:hypothetical protein [Deltaproteobacteria bacterium]